MFNSDKNNCIGNHKNIGFTYITFKKNDHLMTKKATFLPLLKYVSKDLKIWMPFYGDGQCAEFLREEGYQVIHEFKDFYKWEPDDWDVIIDNPPYSDKVRILERCSSFGKPFCLLLPLNSISTKYNKKFLESLNLLLLNKKHHFDQLNEKGERSVIKTVYANPINPIWFCYNFKLPSTFCTE